MGERRQAPRPPYHDIVRSFERGLAVIGVLGVPGPGRTAIDVADELGLTEAATHRVLHTLCTLGYARATNGCFALTPKVLELGYRQWSGLGLADIAKPHLDRLLEETTEACSVSIFDGNAITCVACATPARLICAADEVGTQLPAHATAQGRVLLAALAPEELAGFLARAELRQLTRATITHREALRRELEIVRRRGWALVSEELEPGLRSVAVGISDRRATVAAIGIVSDAHRVSMAKLRRLLPLIRAAGDRIEADLALTDTRWAAR